MTGVLSSTQDMGGYLFMGSGGGSLGRGGTPEGGAREPSSDINDPLPRASRRRLRGHHDCPGVALAPLGAPLRAFLPWRRDAFCSLFRSRCARDSTSRS
ncbi:hypothetical protein SHIRM173S_03753 [Streptomyces hirsutus]